MQRWVVEKVPREEQEEECSFEPTPFCEDFKVKHDFYASYI